jgi:hypothetical protein
MTIVAKPVIEKQFWILQEGNRKVGNVEATAGGFQVRLNNRVEQFKTIKMVEKKIDIKFETTKHSNTKYESKSVQGYPATGRVYNPVWDVQKKLPLYTKSLKSKSVFVAGWFSIHRNKRWMTINSPKLIVVQRYDNRGPFFTKEEAEIATAIL